MKSLIAIILLILISLPAFAETFKWEDKNGIHFTDNPFSIPKKYRQKAIDEARGDITTADPEIAQEVTRSNSRANFINQRDYQQERREARAQKQREDAARLAKTYCTGISGECGPGRACVYSEFMGKRVGKGICKDNAEADRIVAEANQRQRDTRRELQQQQRDFEQRSRDQELNNKLDSIDRRLKWGM